MKPNDLGFHVLNEERMWVCVSACVRACVFCRIEYLTFHFPVSDDIFAEFSGNLPNGNDRLRICVILNLKNRMLYNVVFSASQKGFFHPLHVV